MAENKQKKVQPKDRTILIEGVAKKISKQFERVIEQFQESAKIKNEEVKTHYDLLCREIEDMAMTTNDCYRLFIGDQLGLTTNSRNPHILLKYTHLFMTAMLEVRKHDVEQKQVKKKENEDLIMGYNQNNIYQLVAKNNIEFLELDNEIKGLRKQLHLAGQRALVAEQMTERVRQSSEQMLAIYRENFVKISEFLKLAESKQQQLLQSNRLLNEQKQTLNYEFDIYRKNFKRKTTFQDKERRLRQRLQKQFDDKLQAVTKQLEYQYKTHKPR